MTTFYTDCMKHAASPGSVAYAAELAGSLIEGLGEVCLYGSGALLIAAMTSLHLNIANYFGPANQGGGNGGRAWALMERSDAVAAVGGTLWMASIGLKSAGQWLASRETQCLIGNAFS